MRRASSPLSAIDAASLEQLHHQYRRRPDSLDESWRVLFEVLDEIDAAPRDDEAPLRQAIRAHGHLLARLDPLDPSRASAGPAALAAQVTPAGAADSAALARRYAGTLTVETAHIDAPGPRAWLQSAFEALPPEPPAEVQRDTLRALVEADEFERFLAKKFPTKKRFGAEGAEAALPLLRRLLERAAAAGVTHVVIGAMHRGRFNLVATVLRKPRLRLLAEMKGAHPFAADPPRAADVPYHLGLETVLTLGGRELKVSLQPNPSHLEAVNAVALGRARALQDLQPEGDAWRVLPIVLHTDAAVVAQGVVGEMLQLSGPPGFSVGGAVHVVIDNRIGFTTEEREARTSRHCTGPWKAIDSAILHVNGEDPAAVVQAADLALDWRLAQRRDAVIDLVCYRRNGHNEIDEPSFTQPLLYQAIARQLPVAESFAAQLVARGIVMAEEVEAQRAALRDAWQRAYDEVPGFRPNESGYPNGAWAPHVGSIAAPNPDTGVDEARLRGLAARLAAPPDGVALHPRIGRILRQREIGEDRLLAWPTAEALAFATLLAEGTPLRLTGQDVVRGAFSHRHFALTDVETGARHIGLQHLAPDQARFAVHNSPLSEYAVLGFEYGYSLERPEALAIWEAQFGDFANGAQIAIDHFIVNGEEKWCRPSGLVLLLPHGLEGQGPEHSSARIERWLQLAARDNLRIVQPSTPSNYFHLLRRQVLARGRRPLVVFSPKKLLRLPAAVSALDDFLPGRAFVPVIARAEPAAAIRRVLLCSGKLAYDLEEERARRGAGDVAIVRLEQLYPFPDQELAATLRAWHDARMVWVQEEPANMGAWSWLDRRLEKLLRGLGAASTQVIYCGRPDSPCAAASFHDHHERDQQRIVSEAFSA